jgi:phosphoglucomutase
MGTAGLRKKVGVFRQPHYLESFLQAVFETLKLPQGSTLVLGGDGRYYNDVAIQTIVRMAAAAGARHLVIGRGGLLSTPAASIIIRSRRAQGGFLLTASHNPGGPSGDFGIKFNMATGGQAPAGITDAVFAASQQVTHYDIADLPAIDFSRLGTVHVDGVRIEVIDPVADYLAAMESLLDFEAIRGWLGQGHRVVFDAMHGVTGPYAKRILGEALGARDADLLHADPLPDFGGFHPDPNPVDGRHLVELTAGADAPDLAAASDGDGDRNMILGPKFLLSPGDSIAMMLAHTEVVPGYRQGVPGAARSMPTSRAVDAVARKLGIPCYETPTGWRFFCNLLETGRMGLCGEESFGTGSSHAREKDGLWAVLYWLNVIARRDESLPGIAMKHWRHYGRHYFRRLDYEIPDASRGDELVNALRKKLPALAGSPAGPWKIDSADDFAYHDPVDDTDASHQGVRLFLSDGSRIVYRLSGTGTSGATLRVYLEKHETEPARLALDPSQVLGDHAGIASALAGIERITGLAAPSAVI